MARLLLPPLVTLVIGYMLGYLLYPVSQLWLNECFSDRNAVPYSNAHAQSIVERRSAKLTGDGAMAADSRIGYAWHRLADLYARRAGGRPPAHLSSEFTVRGRILIGVITAQKYLETRAKAVHDTWAKEIGPASKIVFYVGEECDTSAPSLADMAIVCLRNVSDATYPPQRKVFAALQHMYRYHGNSYHWFVRADDDVYIRVQRLDTLLGRLDPNEKIYLGRAGVGRRQDVKRLQLRSSERYCMGGPGVVLSRASLAGVAPHLGRCLKAVEEHNRSEGVGVSRGVWFNEDVELGRCISRTIGVQCSRSTEVSNYFIQDYDSAALQPSTLWGKPLFRQLITLHPIKRPEHMYSVHQFYTVMRRQSAHKTLAAVERTMDHLCTKVPFHLLPQNLHVCQN